jgi:hypothetical protein
MREPFVRARLLIEFLLAIPLFVVLIVLDPESYAQTLKDSERSIQKRILKYRNAECRPGVRVETLNPCNGRSATTLTIPSISLPKP